MKKVLLTGVAGFVGSNILPILLEKYKVIGIDSLKHGGKEENISEFIKNKNFKFIEHDLNLPFTDNIKKEIKEVETVFNMASYSSVEMSIDQPKEIINNNINLMLTILEECRHKKIIHMSSDEVYGESLYYAHGENFNYNPSNPHAASKAAQENIIFSYWRTYGMKTIICNSVNLVGIKQTDDKFLPLIIKKINRDEMIKIYSVRGEIGSRTYMDVKNIGDALIFIDEQMEPNVFAYKRKKERPLKINIHNKKEKKINNLRLYFDVCNYFESYPIYEIIDVEMVRPGYDRNYLIKPNVLDKHGWKPKYNLKETMPEIFDWYHKRYEEYHI